ncbi:hypothetical protein CRUP_001675 [Coryphaenoides rupestris]|nr:hypothetical protein CRUP_001675 [Coryphaenoides rupestris]
MRFHSVYLSRLVCHLPCINGGKCSARDKCQCPPNFTGKFCQMAVQSGHQQHQQHQQHHQQHQQHQQHHQQHQQHQQQQHQQHQQQQHQQHQQHQRQQQQSGSYSQTHVHATHTLPLTYSNGQNTVKFGQGIVNIHVKHPPEASVQIHQVSQLDALDQASKLPQTGSSSSSSSSYTYHHVESSQKIQHHGPGVVYPPQHGYQVQHGGYQPVTSKSQLGRCYQETAGSQCGKALPGLSKQAECCGSVGTSWGFHKCQQCPNKPCEYLRTPEYLGTPCVVLSQSPRVLLGVDPRDRNSRGVLGLAPPAVLSQDVAFVHTNEHCPVVLAPQRYEQASKQATIPLMNCPHGYKRINNSGCQDVNECQLQGVCPNGECLNTDTMLCNNMRLVSRDSRLSVRT